MRIIIVFILQISIKSDRCLLVQSLLDDILKIREGSSADKQNISCIDCHHRYHSILAGCTYRNLNFASLQKFQKSLLNSLSTYISLVGVLLLGDLVNLVDEDDSVFCFLHIIVSCRKKLGNNTLNIITDISCLCKGCRVCDGKRHLKKFCKHFYKICFTAASRSDHQHIGFLDFNIVHGICCHSLIMIIYCYRHYFLGIFLTDHIFIQCGLDLVRCRNVLKIDHRLRRLRFLLDLLRLISRILKAAQIDHAYIRHIKKI